MTNLYESTRRTLCVALCLLATSPAAAFDAERFARVVEDGMALWRVPGLAVAVIENGDVAYRAGFGRTGAGAAVDEHTLFANASTTKAMVAAGILILADDGLLSLDDPVIEHLPEVHFHDEALTLAVTIRDLLAHRTGLPRTDFWTFRQRMPLEEQVRRLRLVEPGAGPRERLLYQNTMYELAGLVIERVSGKAWYEFLDERLWEPIGMTSTYGMRGQIPDSKSHVLPHDVVDGEVQAIPFDLLPGRDDAAGSAWTSLHDMTLWAGFLLDGGVTADGRRLVSVEGIAAMFEPAQLSTEEDFYPTVELTKPQWRTYALGWFQQDFEGRRIDFHTGSLDGLVAIIGLDRDADRAVVVLQNMDGSELRHALLWEALDTTPPAGKRDWLHEVHALYEAREAESREEWREIAAGRIEGTRPSLPVEAFYGSYRNEILGEITFAAERGDPSIPVPARPEHDGPVLRTGMYEYELSHWHLDTFLVDYVSWTRGSFATFGIDPDGRVATLDVFDHVFERVESADD